MSLRKYDKDARSGFRSPVPTQIVSNEEFPPYPQTGPQRRVECLIAELSDRYSQELGMTRRRFLMGLGGMAAAFAALNLVYGRFFDVSPAEIYEPAAHREKWPKDQFVLDMQTHHVDASWYAWARYGFVAAALRRLGRQWNPDLRRRAPRAKDLYLTNFVKEIFLDSDTVMALLSGVPSEDPAHSLLPPEEMARTRDVVNDLAGSRRMLVHGLLAPNRGPADLEYMERQVRELKVDAWKGYTAATVNGRGWWLDDERVAYPAYEMTRRLGVKHVCVHKGLPLQGFPARLVGLNPEYCAVHDVPRAVLDFPDLNFILYHSGFRYVPEQLLSAEAAANDSGRVDWVTDVCAWRRGHPRATNLYMEIGSTFGMTAITNPRLCAHILGQLVAAFGDDHILWGTDSIWWGSPQWQIEALRRFQIPEEMQRKYGYAPLTPQVKDNIFGANAARLFGIDPGAERHAMPRDSLSRLKAEYREQGAEPSNTQYGWVRG